MAWHFSKQQIDTQVEAQFQREADQVVELVSERMLKYEDALWGGVSAIQARGGDISFRDWRVFAKHLRIEAKYPGINGIGVIHHVPADKLGSYLAEQRADRPRYDLHPKHGEAEYWPITYIDQDFHFGPGTVTGYTPAAPNTTSFRAEPCTSPPPVGARARPSAHRR